MRKNEYRHSYLRLTKLGQYSRLICIYKLIIRCINTVCKKIKLYTKNLLPVSE